MSAGIVCLHPGVQLTGTGTLNLDQAIVAGYVNTDGSNDATVELRDGDENGPILFKWDSPIATSFWPTLCATKVLWYSVSGTGVYVMAHSTVI